MSNPKEKAIELFKKYYCMGNSSKSKIKIIEFETAKRCALIAVESHQYNENNSPFLDMASWIKDNKYWQEVKQEIEKL